MGQNDRKDAEPSTAEKILAAAEELLGEHGYDGTSMRDVARRAGVNKALVFYHYGSKGELFDTIIERYYEAHRKAIQASLTRAQGEPRDRIHQLIDDYLDFIEENSLYPRLIQQEVARRSGRLTRIRKNLAELSRAVGAILEAFTPSKGPLATRHFFMTVSGMVINYYTYAPVLGDMWGTDPMSAEARHERRRHLHWMVETVLDRLITEGAAATTTG
jgi:AcrR family transcriptional regulator